jgi:hypothetical protein
MKITKTKHMDMIILSQVPRQALLKKNEVGCAFKSQT